LDANRSSLLVLEYLSGHGFVSYIGQ